MDKSVLKHIPTMELVRLLSEAYKQKDQILVNVYSYELSYRIYKMDKERFIDILKEFGYKPDKEIVLKKEDK